MAERALETRVCRMCRREYRIWESDTSESGEAWGAPDLCNGCAWGKAVEVGCEHPDLCACANLDRDEVLGEVEELAKLVNSEGSYSRSLDPSICTNVGNLLQDRGYDVSYPGDDTGGLEAIHVVRK